MECDSVRMWNENKMYRNVLFDLQCQCSRKLKFKRLKCSNWNSVVKISRRSLRLHKFTRTYIFHYTALKRTTSSSNRGRSRWSLLPAISLNHAPLSPLGLFLSPPSSAGSVVQGMRRSYEKRPEANAFCSVVRKMRVIFFLLRCHYPLNYGQPWHASQWPLRGISSRTILLSHRRELNDPEKSA